MKIPLGLPRKYAWFVLASTFSAFLLLISCSDFYPAGVDRSHALVIPVDLHYRNDSLALFPGTLREQEQLRLELAYDTTVHADSLRLQGLDDSAQTVWSYQFPHAPFPTQYLWTPTVLVRTHIRLFYYVEDTSATKLVQSAQLFGVTTPLARAAQIVKAGSTWSQSISAQSGDSLHIAITCTPPIQVSLIDSAPQSAQILWTNATATRAHLLVKLSGRLFYVVKNTGKQGSITDTIRVEREF